MKDSLYLAAMLRRFTREKEEMRKRNPSVDPLVVSGGAANKSHSGNATNLPLVSNSTQLQASTAGSDLSLTDLTSDPAVMSLLGSASEKELQDLLGDLDFGLLDTDQQNAMVTARENGILGIGAPAHKAAVGGGGQGRGLGSSSGLFSPPPLPDGLPAPLIKRIEDLRVVSILWSLSKQLQLPIMPLQQSETQTPLSLQSGSKCLLLLFTPVSIISCEVSEKMGLKLKAVFSCGTEHVLSKKVILSFFAC